MTSQAVNFTNLHGTEGRPYFISKALAGRYIRLVVLADRLIVDAAIPLHKEYPLV